MLSARYMIPKVPTKPTKQPLYGPRHFVVGTGDFFSPSIIKGMGVCMPVNSVSIQIEDQNKISTQQLHSPRGPQEPSYITEDVSSTTSTDDGSIAEAELLNAQSSFASLPQIIKNSYQDPDLSVNYSEDLDFLAEKLLLQEEEHQNLVKQLQTLKDVLKEMTSKFQPDYMEHAIKCLGNKKVPKQTIGQLFGLEGEIRSLEAKLVSLSKQVLTAQAQVALGVAEVSSFSSSVSVKSGRVDALGLLNYGSIAKRMISEINDAQIYCDLLTIWAQDLTKFNHNLCYEVSSLEASIAENNQWLKRLKTALAQTH